MKRHRWYEWTFLALFIFFSVLILVEAGMNGTSSGHQSRTLAFLFDRGAENASIVLPKEIRLEGKTEVEIGENTSYSVFFVPENTSDKRVSYSLEQDGEYAGLNGNVLVPLSEGNVTLNVSSLADPSLTYSLSITIQKEKITSLTIALDTDAELVAGMTSQIKIESNVSSLEMEDLLFSSSDESVASIDPSGLIRTKKEGNTSISVTTKDGSVRSNAVSLKVLDGEFIPVTSLKTEETSFYAKSSVQVVPSFNEGASDKRYAVSTGEENLSAGEDGKLSSSVPGTYSYTVTSLSNPSVSYKGIVTVNEVKAKGISFSDATVRYGQTARLRYSLIPEIEGEKVTNTEVTYSVSDSSVAEINEEGTILGKKKGSVTVALAWKEDPSVKAEAEIAVSSLTPAEFNNIHTLVRKLVGHFTLFLVTGLFGALVLRSFVLQKKEKNSLKKILLRFFVLLVYGFLLAVLSEGIQIRAENRGPSWNDVGIDFGGYVLPVLIFLAVILVRAFRKETKTAG